MKLLFVALACQALLVLQVHCAGKKTASSEPKVTSQVTSLVRRSHACCTPAQYPAAYAQVFFDIEIDDKPAGKHFDLFSFWSSSC